MKKKWIFAAALSALLFVPRGVGAIIGTIDNVPAATLLVPYFEVDTLNVNGRTTMFSINNASASAVLAHVTLWTDQGVPTLNFNVYLTGYDVQTINVRDLFDGTVPSQLPATATAGNDPNDAISPKGAFSQDINFASCNSGFLPYAPLTPTYTQALRDAHTGLASSIFAGGCGAQPLGDGVARGYITVDTVNSCTSLKPGDATYFTTFTTNQNVLFGDYFLVDPANNSAKGDALVHIEASGTDPLTTTPNAYTFYGHLDSTPWNAADNREALGSIYVGRFLNGGIFDGGTQMIVWRDARHTQGPFACGTSPAAPLGQQDLVAFNEQEWPQGLNGSTPFPVRTQQVQVSGGGLPVAYSFGWLYMNLKHGAGVGPSLEDPYAAQSYVAYAMQASGRFSVAQAGSVLENAATASSACIGGQVLVGGMCF